MLCFTGSLMFDDHDNKGESLHFLKCSVVLLTKASITDISIDGQEALYKGLQDRKLETIPYMMVAPVGL